MKSNRLFILYLVTVLLAGCGGGGGGGSSSSSASSGGSYVSSEGSNVNVGLSIDTNAPNVLAVTVNDPSYPNKPTVTVTVCAPGTSNCKTIDNVLLDTGSYGLRIFNQALSGISLPQVTVNSAPVAECVAYVDNSGDWGPVKSADLVLGKEKAPSVPIQIIDAGYSSSAIPSQCKSPNVTALDQDPTSAGFNGILGVGVFAQDCGQGCESNANNGLYFSCSGADCSKLAVPLASQVQNPVALLLQDNNGLILQFPSVPSGGVQSVTGRLTLGIGTRSNNTPPNAKVFPTDANGEFTTKFNGQTFTSFIDTGSNGLFFDDSSLQVCSYPYQDWYCAQLQTLGATNVGDGGSPTGSVSFWIGNAANLFQNPYNTAFAELGGTSVGGFDWGLPFFFGRTVVVGMEGTSSPLGQGPYWAY
ncbi:MAG TPA: DUF3443 domain-containing protein [Geobacteraceae bacterium]|nr:DUF3443 domain-containing protein [Geobacteraceae bacterium]